MIIAGVALLLSTESSEESGPGVAVALPGSVFILAVLLSVSDSCESKITGYISGRLEPSELTA